MVDLKIGAIIVVAVAIIFGAVILDDAIAPTVGQYSTLTTARNHSVTAGAASGTVELLGQRSVGSSYIVINASSGAVVTSNFTMTEGLGSEGLLSTLLQSKSNAVYASYPVNVSYTYEPDGYMHGEGDRSIFTLITLVSVIALVVFVFVGIKVKDLFNL